MCKIQHPTHIKPRILADNLSMRISKSQPPRFFWQVPQSKIRSGIRQSQDIPQQLPQVFREVFMKALGIDSVRSGFIDALISGTLSFPVFQSLQAQRKRLRSTQREIKLLNQHFSGRPQTATVHEILEFEKADLRNALQQVKKEDFQVLDEFCARGVKGKDLMEILDDFAVHLEPSVEKGDPCLESIGKNAMPLFANFLRIFGTERVFYLYRTFSSIEFQDVIHYLVKKESDTIWHALAMAFADTEVLKTYLEKGELNLRINGKFSVWAFNVYALEQKGPPQVSIELPKVGTTKKPGHKWIIPMSADPYERFIHIFKTVEEVLI